MTERIYVYLIGDLSSTDKSSPFAGIGEELIDKYGWAVMNRHYATNNDKNPAISRARFKRLMEADLVVLLPGWNKSRRAVTELALAVELEIKMVYLADVLPATGPKDAWSELLDFLSSHGFTVIEHDKT